MITAQAMIERVKQQLAIDVNCQPGDFGRDGFVFVPARENEGRRAFPREKSHFDMITMGGAVIVSATPDLLPMLKKELHGKSRDEAFSMPFVYGHSMYYLPDLEAAPPLPQAGADIRLSLCEREQIPPLYAQAGFENALMYDINHARPDVLAITASVGGQIIAICGASLDSADMWQVGIDVLKEHREHQLATLLVQKLTLEILERGKIPYYGTASSNIASQRVAHRAGYAPAWMCCYQGRFESSQTGATG